MRLPLSLAVLLALAAPLQAAFLIFPDSSEVELKGDTKSAYESYKEGNFADAIRIFRAEAGRGDKDAMFALGRIYEEGRAIEGSMPMAENWYRKSAQAGHGSAQFNLGALLLNSADKAAEGLDWMVKAGDRGYSRAMLVLGSLYANGQGVKQNAAEAKKWLEKAVGAGEPEAYDLLGQMYANGTGVEKRTTSAMEMFENAAKLDFIPSMLKLAVIYLNGVEGVTKDSAKALDWFRRAAEKGNTEAIVALGAIHEQGNSVEKNPNESYKWYLKAAEAGDVTGITKTAMMLAEGVGTAKDEKKAMEWYLKAAEKGGAHAMYAISGMYEKGAGVVVSPKETLRWTVRAALSGMPQAMRDMGKRYRVGKDVNKDTIAAQSWFLRAAQSGDPESAITVSDILIAGEGGLPPDPKAAKSILTRAAELGMMEAQLKLADYYEKGLVGRPDLIRAYALLLATRENETGRKALEALEKKMTKEQIAQGRKEYERIKEVPKVTNAPADGAPPSGALDAKTEAPAAEADGASKKTP